MSASRIFYTSDLHLFHDKVANHRGYGTDVAWHNHAIRETWKAQVRRDDDQVWILGDLTGGGHLEEALDFLLGLPGEKHLILGNHDQAHPMHRDSHRKIGRYSLAFTSVQLAARHKIAGRDVLLSHFPYQGDHSDEDRYTQWRLRDEGLPLLHGHTHSGLVRLNQDNVIHAGWDAWHRLVPRETVADLLI